VQFYSHASKGVSTLCAVLHRGRLPCCAFYLYFGEPIAPIWMCQADFAQGKIKWPASGVHIKDFEFLKSLVPEKVRLLFKVHSSVEIYSGTKGCQEH
jgi:hypothetical protein